MKDAPWYLNDDNQWFVKSTHKWNVKLKRPLQRLKNFLGEPAALDDLGWNTNHGLCPGDKVRIKIRFPFKLSILIAFEYP